MRIVVAQMSHETNTFSPVITDLKRFSHDVGERAISTFRATATCLGGYIALCEAAGAEIVLPIAAGAPPSGPVEDAAFEYIAQRIVAAAERGCDAMLLELHGAMVTRDLRRRRRRAPCGASARSRRKRPIAVSLDMHANLYPATRRAHRRRSPVTRRIRTSTSTRPRDAPATPCCAMLAGEVEADHGLGQRADAAACHEAGHRRPPNTGAAGSARGRWRRDGALAASLFTGFPHADIEQAGLSVVVVTDGDRRLAEQWRDELLDQAWKDALHSCMCRSRWRIPSRKAKPIGREPGGRARSSCSTTTTTRASGGTMDTTEVLAEILRQGLDDVAVFGFFDPAAVQQMVEVGVGNEVTVSLGGKTPMPSVPGRSRR